MQHTFGQLLGQYRTRARLEQAELAESARISRATISDWENDKRLPRFWHDVLRLAIELDLSKSEAYEFFSAAEHDPDADPVRSELVRFHEQQFFLPQHPPIPLQRLQRAQHFTGRDHELKKLLADLQPGRVVTLCGPGGIGKSALTAEAIHELAPGDDPPERFPDGIVVHQFYNQPEAAYAFENIATSFGIDTRSGAPKDLARQALALRKTLVVLDGAESCDDLNAVLAIRGKDCSVLISTRHRQDIRGMCHELEPLENTDAVRLLQGWAGHRASDQAAASRICTLLGALPLAVELAGTYMANCQENAADYLAWLETTPLAALDFGERQHESVDVLLQRSVAQLTEPALCALSIVGLLSFSSFSRDAVAAALKLPPEEAGRHLAESVNLSLLRRPRDRYTVTHALVRAFARERLTPPGDALIRLANHFTALANEQTPNGAEGFAVLDPDRQHFTSLIQACIDHDQPQSAHGLSYAIDDYLDRQGYWTDRENALQAALTAARALEKPTAEAGTLNNLGIVYRHQGEWERAIAMYERSLETKERVGDVHGMAQTYNNLGLVYAAKGEWERAIAMYERSLETFERVGDVHGMASTWTNMASLFVETDRPDQAKPLAAQAFLIFHRLGSPHVQTAANILAQACGPPEAADAYLEQFVRDNPNHQ